MKITAHLTTFIRTIAVSLAVLASLVATPLAYADTNTVITNDPTSSPTPCFTEVFSSYEGQGHHTLTVSIIDESCTPKNYIRADATCNDDSVQLGPWVSKFNDPSSVSCLQTFWKIAGFDLRSGGNGNILFIEVPFPRP